MAIADPKPAKRIRDPKALAAFHELARECLSCGHGRGIEAHHILHRSRGGDDVLQNLAPLCSGCHHAYHGFPTYVFGVRIDRKHVERALAAFIRSEDGMPAALYLSAKLGAEPAVAFLEGLEQ